MSEAKSLSEYPVGIHLFPYKGLHSTLEAFLRESKGIPKPCQMILHPANGSHPSMYDIEMASEVIGSHNIPYFTHSSLGINLCKEKAQDLILLQADLLTTAKLGGRGVVVHVGKSHSEGKSENPDDYAMMLKQIRSTLMHACPECPLLIETPAGQKNELCSRFSDFSQLYSEFKKDPCLKICVDTCHIFAAGYDPLEYLQLWDKTHGADSIALVHLNDSKHERTCCKDRHEFIGKGFIGMDRMLEVIRWCTEKKIPMVFEPPSSAVRSGGKVTVDGVII